LNINDYLLLNVPNLIQSIVFIEKRKQYKYYIKKTKLIMFVFFIQKQTLLIFNEILDVFCIDFLNLLKKDYRFQINYLVLNMLNNIRLLIKYNIKNNEIIESLYQYSKAVIWLEREIWDLFGIFIMNNPDLRRILTDYGFQGNALKKDFPLSGYIELLYDIELKKLYIKLKELTQEYRGFEFNSPWILQNIKNI